MRRFALLGPLAVVLLGCPASLDDRCADGACTPRVDADGGASQPQNLPPGCTLGQTPKDSLACVDDQVGVFVSDAKGDDANPGTIAQPVKTLAAAVSLATSNKKPNIYVCSGNYTASLDLRAGTSLYGGIDCDFKTAVPDRPHWTAASPGFALRVANVDAPVVVSDFVIDAVPAKDDGESSIGVLVTGSKSVRMVRVDVTAADGRPGKNKAALAQASKPAKASPGSGDGQNGGDGASNMCSDGTSTGGTGGKGGLVQPFATAGAPPKAGFGTGGTSGDTNPLCMGTGVGKDGKPGDNGDDAPKPTLLGALTEAGWAPLAGDNGKDGTVGQGGGGGGGNTSGGGGGGAGGCGGRGGEGGGAGGASIALAVVASSVALDTCKLVSGVAGKGGTGAPGQLGQPGGLGGEGGLSANFTGCRGGNGGDGGNGGAGAGGAGGIAPAVLQVNANVELAGSTTTPGTFGAAGAGGNNNDGMSATAQAVLKL